jgi:branched-chain amino acid transport system substrate-binding protein
MRQRPLLGAVAGAVLALALLALAACGGDAGSGGASPGPAATPFKVGVAGAMSGQYAAYGASQRAGAEIAVAALNAAGGVNGGEVSMVIGDDRGDPGEAVLVARKFVADAQIVVVDGHELSGATIAAGPEYETAGLPMISPSATDPRVSDLGAYVWRVCITDALQGKQLADYSVSTLGKQRIAVISVDTDYGRGLADAYRAGVAAAGGTIVSKARYALGDTDFTAQLTKLKAAAPELLFLSGYYAEGAMIARQARALGLDVQLLGSDGSASDELPRLGAAAVEGMLIGTFFDSSRADPAVQEFVAAYRQKHGGADPDWFAANSYDVVMLAAQAAGDAGKNERAAINEALAGIGTYQGVCGAITFDANGDVVKPLSIVAVQAGKLVSAPEQPAQ